MADLPRHLSHAIWIATENILRFQIRLKSETNIVERNMLECTLTLEREKLAMLTVQAGIITRDVPSFAKSDGGKK